MSDRSPKYLAQVPPHGDPASPPPFRFDDAVLHVLTLPAKGDVLASLVDRLLNQVARSAGSPWRWEPVTDLLGMAVVQLQIIDYPKMAAMRPEFRRMGYSRQSECLFQIMVRASYDGLPVAISSFVPWVMVDNCWSMITAREVIGLPKVFATFERHDGGSDQASGWTVSTEAMRKYAPSTRLEWQQTVDVKIEEGAWTERETSAEAWPYGPLDEVFGEQGARPLPPSDLDLLKQMPEGKSTAIGLKQFRDAVSPELACYQALVSFDYDLMDMSRFRMMPPATIELSDPDSMPLTEQLGLPKKLVAPMPYAYDLTFELTNTQNLAVLVPSATPDSSAIPDLGAMAQDSLGYWNREARRWTEASVQASRGRLGLEDVIESYQSSIADGIAVWRRALEHWQSWVVAQTGGGSGGRQRPR